MYLRNLSNQEWPALKAWLMEQSEVEMYLHRFVCSDNETVPDCISHFSFGTEMMAFGIASDEDECMGIVNLHEIKNGTAELFIAVKSEAKHRGYAWFGMEAIIQKAFIELNLESVYWCVSLDNKRAIRFFDKHRFHEVVDVPESILEQYKGIRNLKWYSVLKGDKFNVRKTIAGCKVLHIKTIPTVNAGELSFFEATHEVPFEIKRIYYISKVPEGVRRGFHAHKKLKQLLFCPFGRIQLILENRYGREEIELSDPSIGVLIEECTWREMLWLEKNSVLCVAASDYYQVEDYIRDYEVFKKYMMLDSIKSNESNKKQVRIDE